MKTAENNAPAAAPAGSGSARVKSAGLWSERYELIDAWRGLAALAVVVHHVAAVFIGGPAVMLFFVISGYCIAASVDSCQRKGLGFGAFMMRRVRRIYPPYLLSIAFWAATRFIKKMQTGENDFARFTWVDWLQNLTLTQWVSLVFNPLTYAASNKTLFVAAYWSLCYEEQFYLVMGGMMLLALPLGMKGFSVLKMSGALVGVGLVVNAIWPESACGFFVEYWSLFGFGVLVFHRLCRMESAGMRRAVDAFLVAVLAGAVYMRWFAGVAWKCDDLTLDVIKRAEIRNVYGELVIAAGFALVLIALRPASGWIGRQLWFKPLAWLGAITFSLYLIHQFNLNLISKIATKVFAMAGINPLDELSSKHHLWLTLWFVVQIGLHIGLATVFWFFCERPFLNKSLLPAGKGAGENAVGKVTR